MLIMSLSEAWTKSHQPCILASVVRSLSLSCIALTVHSERISGFGCKQVRTLFLTIKSTTFHNRVMM